MHALSKPKVWSSFRWRNDSFKHEKSLQTIAYEMCQETRHVRRVYCDGFCCAWSSKNLWSVNCLTMLLAKTQKIKLRNQATYTETLVTFHHSDKSCRSVKSQGLIYENLLVHNRKPTYCRHCFKKLVTWQVINIELLEAPFSLLIRILLEAPFSGKHKINFNNLHNNPGAS